MEQTDNTNEKPDKSVIKDLPELIGQVLDKMGRFQIAIIMGICFNNSLVGINHILTSFHTYTPEFYCKDYNTTKGCDFDNHSCPSGFSFNDDDHTIVSEWSLVCSRRLLLPLVNTFYFTGVTIGSIICGLLADKYGRKKILLLCLTAQGVIGLILRTSNNVEWFIVIRLLQGFFIQGLQGCTTTILFEYVPPRFRTLAGVMLEMNWILGLLIIDAASYFVREWRLLQVVITIPTFVALLYMWLIPESIHWLCARNRVKDAVKLCIKTAKLNGDYALIDKNQLNSESLSDILTNYKPTVTAKTTGAFDILRTSCLRKHLFVMILVWFGVAISYYAILFFLPNVSGNRHANFLYGTVVEFIFYIFAYFIYSKFGRRIPLITFIYMDMVACVSIGLIIVYAPEHSAIKDWAILILTFIAKGFAAASFFGMTIYTSELFPTICRATTYGACGFSSRLGSLAAPFLIILQEYFSPIVPMSIIGIILLLGGSLMILLPETLNIPLPITIADAKLIWKSKK